MEEVNVYIIIISLLLLITSVATAFLLFRQQKKNRFFERKGILWYAFVVFLVFVLMGLFGLLGEQKLQLWFRIAQALAIMLGLIHVWQLFSNYEWSNRASYLSETLFTIFITSTGALGLLLGYWAFDYFLADKTGKAVLFYKSAFWLPLPYLTLRTYDLISEIPMKLSKAWYFSDLPTPNLNYSKENVIYVYWNLNKDTIEGSQNRIVDRRARMPKNALLSDCFRRFVNDFNTRIEEPPIVDLREDKSGNHIGWRLFVSRSKRGGKKMLNFSKLSSVQIEEGDFLYAKRVLISKEDIPTTPIIQNANNDFEEIDFGDTDDDDDITITEIN